jgi:sulfonate transport system permease protein
MPRWPWAGNGGPAAVKSVLLGLLLPVVLLVSWETGARLKWWQPNIMPAPSDIGGYLAQSVKDGSLLRHVAATVGRLVAGFAAGLGAALVIGCLTGFSALASRLLDPSIQGLRAIPSIAWAPLFLIWLGIGEQSKVALIALGAFFPIYLNLVAGIRGVDRKLIEVGRIHGLRTFPLIYRIMLPAAFPSFLTGVRGGLGLAWMFVVAAELLGASRGLGFLLDYGQNISRPEIILSSILLFAIFGKLTDALLVALERRALVWQDTFGAAR